MYKDVWSLMRKTLNPVILQCESPRTAADRCTTIVSSTVVAVVRGSRREWIWGASPSSPLESAAQQALSKEAW